MLAGMTESSPPPAPTPTPETPKRSRRPRLRPAHGPSWPVMWARAVVLTGALVGCVWLGGHPEHLPSTLKRLAGPHQSATAAGGDRFREAMELIDSHYYRTVKPGEREDAAVDGIVADLKDPYSAYMPPAQTAAFNRQTSGSYAGIGIQVNPRTDGLAVEKVQPGGPAANAGLRAGDLIIRAAGKPATGSRVKAAAAISVIRGEPGTRVTVTVRRGARELTRTVTRRELTLPLVSTSTRRTPDGRSISVIRLAEFDRGGAAKVAQAAERAVAAHASGVILDLRGNPGGLVDEAVELVSAFQRTGVVVTLKSRSEPDQVKRVSGRAVADEIPMLVLVDKGSASAAEITAAALQDHHRARVIGTRTYGKGVFQQTFPMGGGASLKLTVGEFYTPDGRNLGGGGVKQGAGVKPDLPAVDKPATRADEALDAAVRALSR